MLQTVTSISFNVAPTPSLIASSITALLISSTKWPKTSMSAVTSVSSRVAAICTASVATSARCEAVSAVTAKNSSMRRKLERSEWYATSIRARLPSRICSTISNSGAMLTDAQVSSASSFASSCVSLDSVVSLDSLYKRCNCSYVATAVGPR